MAVLAIDHTRSQLRQTEVEHLHGTVRFKRNVAGFQIATDRLHFLPMPAKTFSAVLEPRSRNGMNWAVIWIPFDCFKVWGSRGHLRVRGEINAFQFRSALLPTGEGRHFMIVNKQMQKGAKVRAGMKARFRMEPDPEGRAAPEAPELDKALRVSRQLQKFYQSLSPSTRREIAKWVASAKQAETRVRRAERTAERFMETIEAERELPPMIRQLLSRDPAISEIWNRMTGSHRRRYLLMTFHYQDPLTRVRAFERAIRTVGSDAEDDSEI